MTGLNVGTVVAKFQADITNLKQGVSQAKQEVSTLGSHFSSVGGKVQSFFSTAGQQAQALTRTMGLMGAAGAAGIGLIGKAAVSGAADFEQTKIALTTMMGSAEDAGNLLQDIAKFAAETPFEMPELATTTKQLMAFGFSAGDAVSGMKTLGDISAGLNVPIGDLAYLFGTLKAQGRAMTIDIRQFAMRGLPIYDALAQVMHTSKEKVSELVEAGKVGFPEVKAALESMTAEGGKFHGSMAAQATSLKGLYSTLSDVIGYTLREIVGINLKGEVQEGSIFDILRKKASEFIGFLDANKEKFAALFTGMIASIREFGQSDGFQMFVSAMKSLGEWIVANQETVLAFLKGLAIALGAIMIVTTVASAIAALTSPIGLIIAAIALLYTAWSQNWGGIREITQKSIDFLKKIVDWFGVQWDSWGRGMWEGSARIWKAIGEVLVAAWEDLKKSFHILYLFFTGQWGEMWEEMKKNAEEKRDQIGAIVGDFFDNIKTEISSWFTEQKQALFEKFEEWRMVVVNFFASLPETIINGFTALGEVMLNYIVTTTQRWGKFWEELMTQAETFFTELPQRASEKLELTKQSIINWFIETKNRIVEQLTDWWNSIETWFDELPDKFTDKLVAVKNTIVDWLVRTKNTIVDWFKNMGKEAPDALVKGYEENKETMAGKIVKYILIFIGLVLATLVVGFIDVGIQAVEALTKGISNTISTLYNKAKTWGTHMMQNFADGIMDGIKWVQDAIGDVIEKAKDKLGFSKNPLLPSEVWGQHFVQNFADGMREGASYLDNAIKDITDVTKTGISGNIAISPASASTVNQTINANINNGVDLEFLGQKMRFLMRSQY